MIPLVHDLRARLQDAAGPRAAAGVHLGATSQDIVDTAAMLVARSALDLILDALGGAADACAALARRHRATTMIGRTLMQQALPTTFGAVAAGWGEGLDRSVARLRATRAELAVQLGGATGTLAGWHPDGPAVRAAFAAELALTDPGSVWHTERSRIAALAAGLGITCGSLAKVAGDVVLLAQTEVGELRESRGGGSSSMPHKHNPVAAITARAAAAQAPGLVGHPARRDARRAAARCRTVARRVADPDRTAPGDRGRGGQGGRVAVRSAGRRRRDGPQPDAEPLRRRGCDRCGGDRRRLPGPAGAMTIPPSWTVEGPDGAPVLVLLHSLGTTSSMWDPVMGPLAEQFRVVRIEARGHGLSPAAPAGSTCTVADLGLDVLAALDVIQAELHSARVHLAGLSIGGMTAMWLAIHHPARIARLALLCTAAHLPPARGWLDRAAEVRAHGMASIVERVVSGWITPALAERDPVLLAGLRNMLADADAESYAQCCEAIAALDLRGDLGRVAAPTLVIAAADDSATPPAHADLIGEGVAGARVEVVANAAHIAIVEQPGVAARLLLAHFGGGATLEAGFRTRRDVLGNEHVDAAIEGTTELTAAFQELITRYAWGDVWSRPGLSRRERSIATLAAVVTMGAEREIAMHVRAAIRNGLTRDEIGEVLLHTALYAGLPRAGRAFAIATEALDALDVDGQNG